MSGQAIHLIDLQVANLRESIRVLHSQRNGHLPISKLPAEILTEIFSLHQRNVTKEYTTQTLDWVGITHICRQWREIALNLSGLWIYIPFHNLRWAEEMIARSKHACLIVVTNCNFSSSPRQAQFLKNFLQQHLSRVQALEISGDSPHRHVEKLFQDIQPSSIPYLSTLSLLTDWQGRVPGSSPAYPLEILDSRLLNATSLRKVQVSTTLGWNSRLFSGLTHLTLGGRWGNIPRTQTSQRDFLDALRRMPTLQHLDLNEPILLEVVDKSSLEPVYLPELRDLTVFDTVPTIEFFLHHVNFSATIRTSIGCKPVGPVLQLTDIFPVLVPLKRLLSERPRSLKLHHIEFSFSEDVDELGTIDLRFNGWVSSGPSLLKGYDPNFPSSIPDFTFFVEWDSEVYDLPSDLAEFSVGVLALFPQDDVVSLLLTSYDIHNDWFTPFFSKVSQLPALNALFLHDISSAELLLEPNCGVSREINNPSMATYPSLLYLDFSYCLLDTPALKTLHKCLKKRSEQSLGPRNLKMDLRTQKVSKRAAALLEKVAEVVWVMDSDFVDSD